MKKQIKRITIKKWMKEQSRTIRVKKQDQYKNKKKDNVIL